MKKKFIKLTTDIAVDLETVNVSRTAKIILKRGKTGNIVGEHYAVFTVRLADMVFLDVKCFLSQSEYEVLS